MRINHHTYETPRVTVFGSAADLTRASFNSTNRDTIFFAGVPQGNAVGSLDACVSEDPQNPSGKCEF